MNRRVICIFAACALSAGCVSQGKIRNVGAGNTTCGGTDVTFINLHYGDSELHTTGRIADVSPGGDFEIRLKPKKRASDPTGVDYENVIVTVSDKPTPPAAPWLSGSGSYNSLTDHKIVMCVPAGAPMNTVYFYDISVTQVGTLDPRARVQ